MGLLDNLENMAEAKVAGSNPAAAGILEMIQNHPGGLSGLVQTFQQSGLGGLVNSWVGTGQNQACSSEQSPTGVGLRPDTSSGPEAGHFAGSRRLHDIPATAHRGGQAHPQWHRSRALERAADG